MTTPRALQLELVRLTGSWSRHDKTLPPGHEIRVKQIGELLYMMGKEPLMQDAYREAHARNPAASYVSALWDGIGGWRW